jgi:uncharacterized cupin superfamily protein
MNNTNIIRLEPNGPADKGLIQDELNPDDFQSQLPVQSTYEYYNDEKTGLYVGVWETSSMQEKFQPYGMDEFMWILEGQVAMVDENNKETIVNAEEAFVIPRGYPCSWKQIGYLKKYYMIYENPNGECPEAPAANGIIIPRSDAPMEEVSTFHPFVIKGEPPVQKNNRCYLDTTGQLSVGSWESTAFESELCPFPANEMAIVLEGMITVTNDNGIEHNFTKGSAFFIPEGIVCSWKTPETVRIFYSIFQSAE